MKHKITQWFIENHEMVQDITTFLGVVFLGFFTKIYKEMNRGKKFKWTWVIAELIITIFVAVSVWAIFDQFLHMSKMFTYVICAWAGSFSTVFHKKTEEFIEYSFLVLKKLISKKSGL